jgi:hypothetical protein
MRSSVLPLAGIVWPPPPWLSAYASLPAVCRIIRLQNSSMPRRSAHPQANLGRESRVSSLRKQHAIATACPIEPGAVAIRGDGLISVAEAARRLQISSSLVHVWVGHGVLGGDQRSAGSALWVRLTDQEVSRLSGEKACSDFLSIRDLMRHHECSAEEVWQIVRTGDYLPYRRRAGGRWEWRFCRRDCKSA